MNRADERRATNATGRSLISARTSSWLQIAAAATGGGGLHLYRLFRLTTATDQLWRRSRPPPPPYRVVAPDQGGYIFYAGASLAGVNCRRCWPRLLLLS